MFLLSASIFAQYSQIRVSEGFCERASSQSVLACMRSPSCTIWRIFVNGALSTFFLLDASPLRIAMFVLAQTLLCRCWCTVPPRRTPAAPPAARNADMTPPPGPSLAFMAAQGWLLSEPQAATASLLTASSCSPLRPAPFLTVKSPLSSSHSSSTRANLSHVLIPHAQYDFTLKKDAPKKRRKPVDSKLRERLKRETASPYKNNWIGIIVVAVFILVILYNVLPNESPVIPIPDL
mmetsp:Transcript_6006/g.18094  ORF Transcript_6006/g.18094 Transcript_6006/m.18094 type:complete len:235 (-) Transcript_6006:1757-2461(-)